MPNITNKNIQNLNSCMGGIKAFDFFDASGEADLTELLKNLVSIYEQKRTTYPIETRNEYYMYYVWLIGNIPDCLKCGKIADVNAVDFNGHTPLYWAVRRGNVSHAQALIKKGADITIQDKKSGDTLLHIASRHGNAEMIQTLIKAGADVKIRNNAGKNAHMQASEHGNFDVIPLVKVK